MAYGNIRHDENFVYINGETLYDVQSASASYDVGTTTINAMGVGAMARVHEGVLTSNMSLSRLAINEDTFTGIYSLPFSGLWRYTDSTETDRYFMVESGYLSRYSFSAAVNSVPEISVDIVSYGNLCGGQNMTTGNVSTDLDGFVDNYVFPHGIDLTFSDGDTNCVQSFSLSFDINRSIKPRMGQMRAIPETFVSGPVTATLEMEMVVDEYSAPRIDSLLCADTEDISLDLKNCVGTKIRGFNFESGILNSVSKQGAVKSSNTVSVSYTKDFKTINDVGGLFT